MRKSFLIVLLFVAAPLLAQDPTLLWNNTLVPGNQRFIAAGTDLKTNVSDRKPGGQKPLITVLACADSRVAPELIFNQTVGDLFVVRAAGNVADDFAIASIEYAITGGKNPPQPWTQLIVVLSHDDCGAVKAALTRGPTAGSPALDALVGRIRESFSNLRAWNPDDPQTVRAATEANARASAAYLLAHSDIIRNAVLSGQVRVLVANYSLQSGSAQLIPVLIP